MSALINIYTVTVLQIYFVHMMKLFTFLIFQIFNLKNRCAPEVLTQNKLTTKGDIWSYGVVVWEAFTHGDNPNICKTLEELREIGIHLLEKGVRLCKPDNCPRDVYELMMKCWFWNPNERPPFTDIVAACKYVIRFQGYVGPYLGSIIGIHKILRDILGPHAISMAGMSINIH